MSKLTTFAAAAIVALAAFPAQAEELNPSEHCNAIATFSESVAEARDNGIPRRVIEAIASILEDPREYGDSMVAVDFAYARPDKTPEQVASFIFQVCWEAYGETA